MRWRGEIVMRSGTPGMANGGRIGPGRTGANQIGALFSFGQDFQNSDF